MSFFKFDTVCVGLPTSFTDQSVSLNGITSWKWDFGDEGSSTIPDTKHYYAHPGEYNVTLEITSDGITYSTTNKVIVKPVPTAGFTFSKISPNGEVISFTNTTETFDLDIASWHWDFGDQGLPSEDRDPSNHGYVIQQLYTVTLIVNAVNGCSDTISKDIMICNEPFNTPEIYAHGPNVWYLACSIDTAKYYRWYLNDNIIPGADKSIYVADQTLGKYKVEISNSGECYTPSDEITIPSEITGIDDPNPFAGLKIYPNPTTGLFTIDMDNQKSRELIIRIFTQNGKQVLNINLEKTTEHLARQIDLKQNGKGMYLINLLMDKYLANRKVVVE
jgi:PKD repeat protein